MDRIIITFVKDGIESTLFVKNLEKFISEMTSKFRLRDEKYKSNSIITSNNFGTFNINDVENHLFKEIREYIKSGKKDELIDISNMCFALWCLKND